MWLMLVIAHVGGYNVPVIAVQDLYNKEDCQRVLVAIKEKADDKHMEFSCIYIKDGED